MSKADMVWVKIGVCGVFLILIVTVANGVVSWRTKSAIEQRVELVEQFERDQRKRNAAVDDFMRIVIEHAKQPK